MARLKLTEDMIDNAYELIKEGHYINDVADYLMIDRQTWYNYYNKGEEIRKALEEENSNYELKDNDHLYLDFFDTVKRANVETKMESLRAIKKAGKRSWQAHAWFLERRFPAEWRMRQETEHTVGEETTDNMQDFVDAMKTLAQSKVEGE